MLLHLNSSVTDKKKSLKLINSFPLQITYSLSLKTSRFVLILKLQAFHQHMTTHIFLHLSCVGPITSGGLLLLHLFPFYLQNSFHSTLQLLSLSLNNSILHFQVFGELPDLTQEIP